MNDPSNVRPATGTLEPLAVGMPQLPAITSLSRRTIERERSAGRFPPPDRVVGKRPLWMVSTIRAWLEGGGA